MFISPRYRQNTTLVLFTFALAFFVILLGAFTRLTDAGLSCPDWPNCYGFITAPHTDIQLKGAEALYPAAPVNIKKAWTEMTHRYFAGTEGILILMLSLSLLFVRKLKSIKSAVIAVALIAMVMVQVLLGMLTVTKMLKPVIVLSHLLTGLSILSTLWWVYLDINLRKGLNLPITASNQLRNGIGLAFILVFAQIALGGWVSTHYAGLACVDFPYCNGQLLPDMQWNQLGSDLISIHMLHRIGAIVTAIYLTGLSLFLLKNQAFRLSALAIIALLTLQISLGILNIVWLRPVWLALTHQAVGILLLLTVIATLVKANYAVGKQNG